MSEFTEPALITTFGTIIGLILWNQLSLRGYFKREMFKTELQKTKKLNEIQLKKLARDSQIPYGKAPIPASSDGGGSILNSVIPKVLSNLSPEQTAAIAEKLIPEYIEDGESESGVSDILLKYAAENPEIIQSFIGGLKTGKNQSTDSDLLYEN